MNQFSSKLPNVGTTIFTQMSQLAAEYQAVNLGQGFPDFMPDVQLMDAVSAAMRAGDNQYAPMKGDPDLIKQIARKVKHLYGADYDANTEITVTAGASQALMSSILALVSKGDEVIIIEPFYDLYLPAVELAGGVPVFVPMNAPSGSQKSFTIDWERVEKAVTNKTRLLIINTPHNPTCSVLSETDLDVLERLVDKYGFWVLSDEVYEHLVFDDHIHLSLCSRKILQQHSIIVSSFGKTFNITGWKVGYCLAPKAISQEIQKVHQYTVFCVPTPMQKGLAIFMERYSGYHELKKFYQERRDYLYTALEKTSFRPLTCSGSFFLLASYASLSTQNEIEFCQWLTKEHQVALIPVSAFYRDPMASTANHQLLRFCFAKKDTTLALAIEKLAKL